MKNYTLTVNRPHAEMEKRIRSAMQFKASPAPGQFVLWDGPARKGEMLRMAEIVRPHCQGLLLACGNGEVQRHIISEGSWA